MKNLQGMLKQVQALQSEMEKMQQELANKTATEEVGGGMVKATVNGKKELISIAIDPEVFKENEKEMLEDLIVAAVNKASNSVSKTAEEELSKLTKGMMPPGFNIPGL